MGIERGEIYFVNLNPVQGREQRTSPSFGRHREPLRDWAARQPPGAAEDEEYCGYRSIYAGL